MSLLQPCFCFLRSSPLPAFIRASKAKVVADALERYGKGRKVSISADEIIRTAKNSIASISLAKELILPRKISTLLHLMEQLDQITGILSELCVRPLQLRRWKLSLPLTVSVIPPVLCSSPRSVISRTSPRISLLLLLQVWDPTVFQSGKFQGTSRISKRGIVISEELSIL